MLSESSTALSVIITVKTDDALRLRTIAKSAIVRLQHLNSHVLTIFRRISRLSEHLRRIEGKFLDGRSQFAHWRIRTRVFALFERRKTGKNILEHPGCSSRRRNELAFSGHFSTVTIVHSSRCLFRSHDLDSPFRGSRTHDFHPRKTFLETLDLSFHVLNRRTSFLDFGNIFFRKHIVTNL